LGYFVTTRAVIFGLDGVLVTTDEMHYRACTNDFQ
jgi:beta-phosphoglucomutase-like phosphatase (HAD superfamily)